MDSKEIVLSKSGDVVFLPQISAIAHLGASGSSIKGQPRPKNVLTKKEKASSFFFPWGDNNLFPQDMVEDYTKNAEIPSIIGWKIRTLISGGIIYGNLEFDDNGNEKLVPFYDAEIQDFMRKSNLNRYAREAASDYYWFLNVFPELVLSNDRSKVTTLTVQEAAYCRYKKQNEKGVITDVYLNGDWGRRPPEEDCIKLPLLDVYYDSAKNLKNASGYNFIYPCSFPTPNCAYYQTPEHVGLRNSGWLEIAAAIPEFKRALMKNQITLKYHIKIPRDYWEKKFEDWHDWDEPTQKAKKVEALTEFVNWSKGANNSGNAFISEYEYDPITRTAQTGWIIEAIDDKLKDGIYIEDSQEASSFTMRAFGVDATLIGQGPGRNQGSSGSGSDKRVARDIYLLNAKVDQDIILEPLNMLIAPYNQWTEKYPKLTFWFRNYHIATLNQVTPDKRL